VFCRWRSRIRQAAGLVGRASKTEVTHGPSLSPPHHVPTRRPAGTLPHRDPFARWCCAFITDAPLACRSFACIALNARDLDGLPRPLQGRSLLSHSCSVDKREHTCPAEMFGPQEWSWPQHRHVLVAILPENETAGTIDVVGTHVMQALRDRNRMVCERQRSVHIRAGLKSGNAPVCRLSGSAFRQRTRFNRFFGEHFFIPLSILFKTLPRNDFL